MGACQVVFEGSEKSFKVVHTQYVLRIYTHKYFGGKRAREWERDIDRKRARHILTGSGIQKFKHERRGDVGKGREGYKKLKKTNFSYNSNKEILNTKKINLQKICLETFL